MMNNVLTIAAFGARLASQAILLLCAYLWLDPASYQSLLLLTFFGSFLSISDLGFSQFIIKKLDFYLQQSKKTAQAAWNKLGKASLVTIGLAISISTGFAIAIFYSDRSETLLIPILLYSILYLVNYLFMLAISACLGLGKSKEGRIFEIIKHGLMIFFSIASLYFFRDINWLIMSQILAGLGLLTVVYGYIFAKLPNRLPTLSSSDQLTSITIGNDFLRSSLGEVVFKSTLLFVTWSWSWSIPPEEANIILTGIKLMDVISVLAINFAYVNLRRLRDTAQFMTNWLLMNFALIFCYALIIFGTILSAQFVWSISVHRHLFLLFMVAWFFTLWRACNFAEFMTNLVDRYWQFKYYLRAICSAGVIALVGYFWQGLNAQIVLVAVLLSVSCTVIPEAVRQLTRFKITS